jgi:hypothetical protein
MGKTPRPVDGVPDQERQALLVRATGNGPSVENEEQLLTDRFGTPDMAGTYRSSDAPADEMREAVAGDVLPPVPDSAYGPDSVPLDKGVME